MKVSEPIGNAAWGSLFVRVTLGMFLLMKGIADIDHIAGTNTTSSTAQQQQAVQTQSVQVIEKLPQQVRPLVTVLFPYLQIISGALLVVGFWTTLGAFIAVVVLGTLVYGVGGALQMRGLFLNKDTILLAAAISLLYSGAGAFSVDQFRKSA